ncbi:MAG: hypothetical protein WBM40_00595 [Thiohalocapsa sp.]
MSTEKIKVPKAMAERYAAITALTDAFCNESKRIRDLLRMGMFDPDWTLPSRLADNPRVWLVAIDGFVLDARSLKRDQQALLHAAGLIPFVHADRKAASDGCEDGA